MKNIANDIQFGYFDKEILSERIASRLLSLIKEKKLLPGDRLPPERELAIMMHVSRPPLREALRALSIMGIIDNQQGSGTYIASLKPSRLIEHLDLILSLDDSTFIDLFEARRIVEVGLTGIAAQNITADELELLEGYLTRSEKDIDDPDKFLECDLEIHGRIAESAHNRILSVLMMTINKLNVASRKRTVEIPDVRQHSLDDHRHIIRCLGAHDVVASRTAMEHHLDYIESRFKETMRPDSKISERDTTH